MKRNFLSILLIFMFTISCFAGCGNTGNTEPRVNFYVGDDVYYTMQTAGNKILQLPNNPSKQGFSFEGWFYDKDVWLNPFTKYDFAEKPITQDVNVYAKFRQNRINYNIRFYTNNNLYASLKTGGNETLTLPPDPIKTNYTFGGWYFDDETFERPFTADAYATKKLAQDVSIYAKFTHNDGTIYKIVFVVENEEYYSIETAGNNALTTFPSNPDKTDYIFMGWFLDKGVWEQPFDAYTFSQKYLTDNVTVYAYFKEPEPEKFTISFIVDDKVYSTIETAGHEGLTLPEDPVKEGFDFAGWYIDDGSFEKEFDITQYETIGLTSNTSIYAKFVEKQPTVVEKFTITFSVDGQTHATLLTLGNETLTLPNEPFKEDYTFDGWYFDDGSFEQPLVESTYESSALTGNVTVYAKFTADVYESNLEYELSSDGTYYIVVGLGESVNAKNILIPNTYKDLPVKEIVGATYDEHNVKVYDGVFYESNVRKIKISANVEKIGRWAIARCFNLVKVEFEDNSKLHTIEEMAFNYSQALTSITLPKGVTKLPQYAFSQCDALTSFNFEDSTTFTEFGPYALYSTGITEMDLPVNLTKIGEHCFADCADLAKITFHKAIKTIDTGAFNDCRKLKYVEIEDTDAWCGVDIADPWAVPFNWANGFYQNGERVKNLVISEGVKEIKKFAFADCLLIESITIPSTVELIESCAFADILRLKTLNYNAKNCKLNFYHSSSHYYIFEHCGSYSLTSMAPGYQYPEGAKHITLNIGATVEAIPSNLFGYAAGAYIPLIKTINFLGTTVPEFGEKWLKGTAILEKVTVPTGMEQAYLTALGTTFEEFIKNEETTE